MNKRFAAFAMALGFASTLAIAGCSSDSPSSTSGVHPSAKITLDSLAGEWILTGVSGPDGVLEGIPEGQLTVQDNGEFHFSAECNQKGGTIRVQDEMLTTNEVFTTQMLCEGIVGEVDDIAGTVLGNVSSSTLTESGTLTLVGPNGESLEFTR
ncbi:META domain-containing protein [Actinomycetaceae bacterium MB13-C1-2]|nr:META domain-containing protein [Actinomycetaceae bacterium MB13-C1-2]